MARAMGPTPGRRGSTGGELGRVEVGGGDAGGDEGGDEGGDAGVLPSLGGVVLSLVACGWRGE